MDIGDVVHLKSGGAGMTVSEIIKPVIALIPGIEPAPIIEPVRPIVCMWHDEAGSPCVERYDERMLVVKAAASAKDPGYKKQPI